MFRSALSFHIIGVAPDAGGPDAFCDRLRETALFEIEEVV
jgi:hypothetical protein